jgi:cytochrome c5
VKNPTLLQVRARVLLVAAMAVAMLFLTASKARSDEAKTDSAAAKPEKQSQSAKSEPTAKPAPIPARKLSGAELYSMHCNRCHPERYPTERTAAQWKTILLHMRVRANLPAEQARTILKYLQENSGR